MSRPWLSSELIGAADLDEANRNLAMLGVGRHAAQLSHHGRGQQGGEVDPGGIEERRHGRLEVGRLRQQPGTVTPLSQDTRIEVGGGRVADEHLTGCRHALGLDAGGRVHARDDELAVHAADEEQLEAARVHADGHLESHGAGGGREAAHAGERLLHADRGGRGALLVVDPAKEQQDGVAAELEEIGVLGVRRRDELGKRRVENEGDLLGTLPAAPGQLLGELREARDVGEHERALEGARLRPRLVAQPVGRDPRNERSQRVGRGPRTGGRAHVSNLREAGVRRGTRRRDPRPKGVDF